MTYDNDDPLRSVADSPMEARRRVRADAGLRPFFMGAVVIALLIVAGFLYSSRVTNDTASNSSEMTVSSPARVNPPASTTGTGATSPPPASSAPTNSR